MSLPESMSRIVIVGTKSRMDEAIEAFYSVKAIHLIDHTTGADGFSIGAPRASNAKASERLLKVRSMEKELGVRKSTQAAKVPVDEIRRQISSDGVEDIEGEVLKALDRRNDLNQRITELNSKKKSLELLTRIPVDLDLYSGYRTITAIAGSVIEDPSEALKGIDNTESFISFDKKEGGVVVVFAKTSDRDSVSAVLADYGFSEISVPTGTGSAGEALVLTDENLTALTADLESVEKDIEAIQMKYKSFLMASDEELSIEVEKGGIPLRIAVGDYSYIMDAWVPAVKVESVKDELESKLGNDIYVEFEETRGRDMHEEEEAEERFKIAPTKQKNGIITKEFEYATSLVSVPKYQEIDPSILIMIFLPLFFGFMVGDCGYAIPFIILGAYGLKVTHHKDWRAIATVLFFGGIWAFLFGFFMFGEAMGMHFIGEAGILTGGTSVTWEYLLGVQFPEWFVSIMPSVGEGFYGIGKLHEVTFLLKLSVYIGIVHLLIGYVCGYINVRMQHGNKEAFWEKGGWILTFIGMVVFCYALTEFLIGGKTIEGNLLIILLVGLVVLIAGVAINFRTEKMQAIMELPGIVGNILSYTRLAAIGMSKAGMALAFNYIVFGMIIGTGEPSIAFVIIGLLMFAFLHLVIWTLAILSAGLHALRLQFVELMTKFFIGGGERYEPLKVKRDKTILTKTETTREV